MTALVLGGGCQQRQRPFDDVVAHSRSESTTAPLPEKPIVPTAVVRAPATQPSAQPVAVAPKPQPQPAVRPVAMPTPATRPSSTPPAPLATPAPSARPGTVIPMASDPRGNMSRAWPVSTALRPSGDMVAGPIYWPSGERMSTLPPWMSSFVEPVEFLIFAVPIAPIGAIITPPWTPITYSPGDEPAQNAQSQTGK